MSKEQVMFKHQVRAVQELHAGKRAIVFPYGTCKAWPALQFALEHTHLEFPATLVLLRPRNMITWRREIRERWPLNTEVLEFAGRKAKRTKICSTPPPAAPVVLLVPWSLLANEQKRISFLVSHLQIQSVIADETTCIKTPSATRTGVALNLADTAFSDMPRITLTGDPMPENPYEIWSQFMFAYGRSSLNPFRDTYYQFLHKWFIQNDYGQWILRHFRTDLFAKRVADACIYLEDEEYTAFRDEAGWPYPQYMTEYYEPTKMQRDLTTQLFQEWSLPSGDEDPDMEYSYVMSIMMKAQQICGGFYYDNDRIPVPITDGNPKLELCRNIVSQLLNEKPERKIIVWRKFLPEDLMLQTAFGHFGCVIGPQEEALTKFMSNPDIRVIIMPVDCSEGFNELVIADTVVFYSNDYSNEKRRQAEARIRRTGQQASIVKFIDLCASNSRDEEVITALQGKDMTPEKLSAIVTKELRTPARKRL